MNPNHKLYLSRTLKLFLGLLILLIGYKILSFELRLRNYQKTFVQVQHPIDTAPVDSLRLEVHSYPATYIADSIQFQSTFLVGEIRSYTEDWESIKSFYADQRSKVSASNVLSLWALPLEMHDNRQKNWLDFPDGFSFNSFQADILKDLQDAYDPKRISDNVSTAERNIYLVYATVHP